MPKRPQDWTQEQTLRFMHGGYEKWNKLFPDKPYDPEIMEVIDKRDSAETTMMLRQQEEIEYRDWKAKKQAQEAAFNATPAIDPYTRYAMMVSSIDPNLRPSGTPAFTHEGINLWAGQYAHLFGTANKK